MVIDGEFTENAGIDRGQILLSTDLPTAVVCANDRIAIGVLDGLRRAGVEVPGQVSVTGYDDSLLAQLGHIDLTSVSQEPREQANRASRRSSSDWTVAGLNRFPRCWRHGWWYVGRQRLHADGVVEPDHLSRSGGPQRQRRVRAKTRRFRSVRRR